MVTLDNFGKLFAEMFRSPTAGITTTFIMKDILGVNHSFRFYGNNAGFRNIFEIQFSYVQVGKGNQPVTRQDFAVEDPFLVAPEDGLVLTAIGGYNSGLGKITIDAQITPTGGAGSVSEIAKFTQVRDTAGLNRINAVFRDLVNPVVPFIIAQTITTEHELLI